MGDSNYRLNFDQGTKNEIQHHSYYYYYYYYLKIF